MRSATHRYSNMLLAGLCFCMAPVFANDAPRKTPTTPAAVDEVILSQPFDLDNGFIYHWRKNPYLVRSGTLVVVRVDSALVYPRNALEPILYAGDHTAQRLNQGIESGYMVALIPGDIDLSRDPIWFGRPGLPERVDADTIRRERALAEKAQIPLLTAQKANSVTRERVHAADFASLLRDKIAELVLRYAPQEKALVESWRLPEASASTPAPKEAARPSTR